MPNSKTGRKVQRLQGMGLLQLGLLQLKSVPRLSDPKKHCEFLNFFSKARCSFTIKLWKYSEGNTNDNTVLDFTATVCLPGFVNYKLSVQYFGNHCLKQCSETNRAWHIGGIQAEGRTEQSPRDALSRHMLDVYDVLAGEKFRI